MIRIQQESVVRKPRAAFDEAGAGNGRYVAPRQFSTLRGCGGVWRKCCTLHHTIRAFDFSGTVSQLAMPHGVSSDELTENRRSIISIAKIAIKVNNFFNVNRNFLEITIT